MENTQNVFKFSNDLMNAYREIYDCHEEDKLHAMILSDSHKERLKTYLEFNGIIGFTNRIYEIATGGL